jgi:hypothetical protein
MVLIGWRGKTYNSAMLTRSRWLVRTLGALIACALSAGCDRRPTLEVLYFYSAICPACEESRKSVAGANSVRYYADQYRNPSVRIYDVLHDASAQDALVAAIGKYGIPIDKQRLPLLIVNGTASSGLQDVAIAITALERRKH